MRIATTLFTPIPGGMEIKTDSLKMWETLDGLCSSFPGDCKNVYNELDSAGFTVSRKYHVTKKGMDLFKLKHMKMFYMQSGRKCQRKATSGRKGRK